jgi:hypothetical protein
MTLTMPKPAKPKPAPPTISSPADVVVVLADEIRLVQADGELGTGERASLIISLANATLAALEAQDTAKRLDQLESARG